MNLKVVNVGLFAATIILILGCAVTPTTNRQQAQNVNISYESAYIVITAREEIRSKHGYAETTNFLRNELHEIFRRKAIFTKLTLEEAEDSTVEVNIEISDFNYVSGAARGLIGIVGGRAVLQVTMRVKDNKTKDTLITVRSAHRSHHGQGVFSPVTSSQVTAIAHELANNIK